MEKSNKTKTLFGRQKTRPLSPSVQALYDTLLPQLLFDGQLPEQKIALEIGMGYGDHLHNQALQNPDCFFIGCEPFINGIGGFLQTYTSNPVPNIRLWTKDARFLLGSLPDNSIDLLYLLFPDPWPKKRHHKRRFLQKGTIELAHRILKPKGLWTIATDHPSYKKWVESLFPQTDFFATVPDFEKPADWAQTRYEKKALRQGREPKYYQYEKI